LKIFLYGTPQMSGLDDAIPSGLTDPFAVPPLGGHVRPSVRKRDYLVTGSAHQNTAWECSPYFQLSSIGTAPLPPFCPAQRLPRYSLCRGAKGPADYYTPTTKRCKRPDKPSCCSLRSIAGWCQSCMCNSE